MLPTEVEELTAEWLTGALSSQAPGTLVDDVEVQSVIWGTATKVFLRASYAEHPDDGPPEELCVKGGFEQEMRAVAGVGCRLEAVFYRDIASHLGVPLAPCWFADADDEANQGILILDDLRARDVDFGEAGMAYSVDEVAAGLEALATWHARTWDRSGPEAVSELTIGSPFFRHAMESMFFQPDHWNRFLELPQTAVLPDELRDRERVVAAMHRQWEMDDASTLCLSHGDAHIGNTFRVPGEKAPRFLDWQVFCQGPWSEDVAYFMVGTLTVPDRQANEERLLRHYLECLDGHGAPAPSFDEGMDAVRREHLHGVMWAFCPPEMQDPDGCEEMGRRHAQAATDHGTLEILERS
jgi:hypothetical protein